MKYGLLKLVLGLCISVMSVVMYSLLFLISLISSFIILYFKLVEDFASFIDFSQRTVFIEYLFRFLLMMIFLF